MWDKTNKSGFTIVEILIGLAVTTTFVLALTIAITNLNKINDRARDLVVLNGLVENKIEDLRSRGYTAVSLGTVDFTDELPNSIEEPRQATYTVSSPATAIKKVDVTITYNISGQQRTLNYSSNIGEFGVGQ